MLLASGGARPASTRLWTIRCNFTGKKRGCHNPCFRSSSFHVFDPTYAVSSRSPVRYLLAHWLEQRRCLSSVCPSNCLFGMVAPEMEPLFLCARCLLAVQGHQGSSPFSSSTTNMRSTSETAITCFFPLGHWISTLSTFCARRSPKCTRGSELDSWGTLWQAWRNLWTDSAVAHTDSGPRKPATNL